MTDEREETIWSTSRVELVPRGGLCCCCRRRIVPGSVHWFVRRFPQRPILLAIDIVLLPWGTTTQFPTQYWTEKNPYCWFVSGFPSPCRIGHRYRIARSGATCRRLPTQPSTAPDSGLPVTRPILASPRYDTEVTRMNIGSGQLHIIGSTNRACRCHGLFQSMSPGHS